MQSNLEVMLTGLDIVVKLLIPVGLYFLKNFADRFKELDESVKELNKLMAVQITKDDAKELRIVNLEKDVARLREKLHEIINNYIGQIVLNNEKIDSLKKQVDQKNN